MEDDAIPKKDTHQVGMTLDALSIAELQERIAALKLEIQRLEKAIEMRDATLKAAASVFKF